MSAVTALGSLPSVYVAGAGVISSIGNNMAECLSSFEAGRTGICEPTYLEEILSKKVPVAEVRLSNLQLADLAGLSSTISRTALLSMIAAKEAMDNASIGKYPALRTGFVSANTVGGMDKTENFIPGFLSDPRNGRLREVVHHECGSITELVADKLGIREFLTTISTACSSSANAIAFGARLIRNGMLDVVVAGGTDALTRFTLNGFKALMILDSQFCRPFDENRMGLNLGEGAGYLVLVSGQAAGFMEREMMCRLSGFFNSNDAYHQTASSPDGRGSYLAMKGALERSGIYPADIGYINLHGTGTHNNDLAEGIAIKRLFGPTYPKMSSTKSFTGHTLGASGGIEAVFSAMAVRHGIIYPNLRWQNPMPELPFVPETVFSKDQPVRHVLSNSFGFGGNCSSLIFSK